MELDRALLDAAEAQLLDHGYAGFTLEAIAERAGTSRPVIARRWPGRDELLRATIARMSAAHHTIDPDTGTLRGDLVALLRQANAQRVPFAIVLGVQLAGYYRETGTSLDDLRPVLAHGQDHVADAIMDRAVARGEADPGRLTPRIRALPFDLFRHHVLMTRQPLPDRDIEEIIDTIFLPLVAPEAR